MTMIFHDHGPAFSGLPSGKRCSSEKHQKLLEQSAADYEAIDVYFWRDEGREVAVVCPCCGWPLVEGT